MNYIKLFTIATIKCSFVIHFPWHTFARSAEPFSTICTFNHGRTTIWHSAMTKKFNNFLPFLLHGQNSQVGRKLGQLSNLEAHGKVHPHHLWLICLCSQWRRQPDNLVNFKLLALFMSLEIDCFRSQ